MPAFLRKDASEQHDPVGDVKELLNLDDSDLRRVVAVHGCLDESILGFGERLREGLRRPITASSRPVEVGQVVRGPIDWSATVARRSLEAGDLSRYAVRSARRIYDIPENRALVWLLDSLRAACRRALDEKPDPATDEGGARPLGWTNRIRRLGTQVEQARATEWLRAVPAEAPDIRTMQKLKAARSSFYRDHLRVAAERMRSLQNPDEDALIEVLSERYFEPAATWTIFEVCVALRLVREFGRISARPRRSRLLVGTGRAPFARYLLDDGSEVSLLYQAWPRDCGSSLLQELGKRHGIKVGASKPDLFLFRDGEEPDVLLLELKASVSPSYLKEGMAKLLTYVADRPELWKGQPAAWLVAPASNAFVASPAGTGQELWIVSADAVAEAAVARLAPQV
ncbi:MAG TPA: hypothetical protein VFJ61_06485 [Solirubrobacterales bacterium]|nr:hypothetical protein [Solirubrobacterales bacterium]